MATPFGVAFPVMSQPKFVSVPVLLNSVKTCKDRSLKIEFVTPELPPDQGSILLTLANKEGFAFFSPNFLQESDLVIPKDVDFPSSKTPSQRLRSALFVLWSQQGKQGEFKDFYASRLEKIIDFVKDKLD